MENEPSVCPADADFSPTNMCWDVRGIPLSARTRVFRCQMVTPLGKPSVMHASPDMNNTCTLTPSMLQNGCATYDPVMNARAICICVTFCQSIEQISAHLSMYQAAYVFSTIATRFLQRGQGRLSNLEP